jgi:hypothetical protein
MSCSLGGYSSPIITRLKRLSISPLTFRGRPILPRRADNTPVSMYPPPGAPRLTANPLPSALVAQVHTMEEKGSDVNLAVHLLNDAWNNSFEAAAVISNDTDLVKPIRMVTQERHKPVFVVCPGRRRMATQLSNVATYTRNIRQRMLAASQLPDPIPGTALRKPPSW